jgi:hypothetical protein
MSEQRWRFFGDPDGFPDFDLPGVSKSIRQFFELIARWETKQMSYVPSTMFLPASALSLVI